MLGNRYRHIYKSKGKNDYFCYNYRENQESKEIMEVLREPYDFLLEGGHLLWGVTFGKFEMDKGESMTIQFLRYIVSVARLAQLLRQRNNSIFPSQACPQL